jgi:hypothetical protein
VVVQELEQCSVRLQIFRQPMNHPIGCGLVFGEKQNDWILAMQNHIVSIDHIHSQAICAEIADRLRIVLTKDVRDVPGSLKSQIVRLRRLDQSPSIDPSSPSGRRRMKYGGGYRGKQYTIVQGTEASSWRWTVRLDEKTIKSGHAISSDAAMNRVVWLIENPVSRARSPFRTTRQKETAPAGES